MLSDSVLKRHHRKPQSKQLTLTDRDGLYVRVSQKGKLSFFMRYRFNGKADQLTLGTYPIMSLKNARDENIRLRAYIEEGKNPKVAKKLELKTTIESITLNGLFEIWFDNEGKASHKKHTEMRRMLERHILSSLGNFPASDLTTHHFYDIFDVIKKKSPHQIPGIVSVLRGVYRMGVRRRLVSDNPIIGISVSKDFGVKTNVVDRYLSPDEIKKLYKWLDERYSKTNLRNAKLIELCLLFGCRVGELVFSDISQWDFFNGIWAIPPQKHKTGRKTGKTLERAVIPEAADMVKTIMQFSRDDASLVTSDNSNQPVKSSIWLRWPTHCNEWLISQGIEPIPHWSMHDLRRTLRTHLARSVQPHVLEVMLGHKLPGIWETYDKYSYLDEQLEAYKVWWNLLQEMRQGDSKVSLLSVRERK